MDLDELAPPPPVVARPLEELLLVFEIGSGAEGAIAGAGQHQHADGVVPTGVLERPIEFAQHYPVDGVQDFRPVQDDRGSRRSPALTEALERGRAGGAGWERGRPR